MGLRGGDYGYEMITLGSGSGRKQLDNLLDALANPEKVRADADRLDQSKAGHLAAAEEPRALSRPVQKASS